MGRKKRVYAVILASLLVCFPLFAAQRSDVYVATNRFQSPSATAASSACLAVDSDQWYLDADCDGTKDVGEDYIGTGHDAVTVAGEDYLSLTDQEITALKMNSDNINWTDIDALEIQRAGINWQSLIDDVQSAGINWQDIDAGELYVSGINWQTGVGWSASRAWTTTPSGANWQDFPAMTPDQVGAVTLNKWCIGDGTLVQCTENAPAASAGGNDTEVQYNNGTALGGMSGVNWDDATNTLHGYSNANVNWEELGSFTVKDEVYDATNWNADLGPATKNAVRDKIETMGAGGGPSFWELNLAPASGVLDDAAPPGITVVESTGTGTPRRWVVDFDAATDEIEYFSFVVPSDMAAGNWDVGLSWFSNDTGANETCCWGAAISATTEADTDSMIEDAVGTIDYACEDVNTSEANRLIQTSITLSDLDSVAVGDYVTMALRRDADSTNGTTDDLSSDARLIGIKLKIPRA